jgi:hypothetical protein
MGLPNIVILSSSRHFLQVLMPAAYVDLCMVVFGINTPTKSPARHLNTSFRVHRSLGSHTVKYAYPLKPFGTWRQMRHAATDTLYMILSVILFKNYLTSTDA